MTDLDVRIVELEPMRVASAYGFGQSPEGMAWDKMQAWAREKGLISKPYRNFGFNNPNPSPASPNYGYEIWIAVGPDVEPDGDIRILEFSGGLYAVARCEGLENIGDVWNALVTWREDSQYKKAHHQWLEELLTDLDVPPEEYVFNLYLPIAE
jgi:AraC family transcriptional regulator